MYRNLLQRIVMRCGNEVTSIARMLTSNDTDGKNVMLRYYQINNDNERSSDVQRYSILLRTLRRYYRNTHLLACDRMSTMR